MEDLHPRRAEILEVLARAVLDGEAPTEREIGARVGLKSSQTVHHHLRVLESGGYVERGEAPSRKRRPVEIADKGWEFLGRVPMLGRIAAGRGLEAVPLEGDALSVPREFLRSRSGRRRYALRVVGQSMTGARIEDGDLLVVEENEDPPDGSVVVALLAGEEVTVKRLYRDGEKIRLVPQNGDHEEIIVRPEDVGIQGEVVLVLHPPGR